METKASRVAKVDRVAKDRKEIKGVKGIREIKAHRECRAAKETGDLRGHRASKVILGQERKANRVFKVIQETKAPKDSKGMLVLREDRERRVLRVTRGPFSMEGPEKRLSVWFAPRCRKRGCKTL